MNCATALKIIPDDECPLAGVQAIEPEVLDNLDQEDGFPAAQEMSVTYELLAGGDVIRAMIWHVKPMAADTEDADTEDADPLCVAIFPADMVMTDVIVAAARISRMSMLNQLML